MKAKEILQKIKGMSREELAAKERSLRDDLFKLQFQHRVRRLENTSRLRAIRREIAKVQTVQNAMK